MSREEALNVSKNQTHIFKGHLKCWVINAHNSEKHEGTPGSDYKSKDENFENLLVKSTENGNAVRIYMTVEQAMLAKVNRPSSR